MPGTLTPERTAARLCELSADARAAVLVDAAGSLAGASELDPERARTLAELVTKLFEAVDRASRPDGVDPPEQVEVQVDRGTVYASRTPRWTLAVVARRSALSSLMLLDLRSVLAELDGAPPIRTSVSATAATELPDPPVPELDPEEP
jgi:predicted regulator of Ras-like GTPase activity (Roadblock/LC7/MglB family)